MSSLNDGQVLDLILSQVRTRAWFQNLYFQSWCPWGNQSCYTNWYGSSHLISTNPAKKYSLTVSHVAGAIIQYGSYKIAFYAMGGAFGLALLLVFLWMPETAFVRVGAVNLDTGSNNVSFDVLGTLHTQ